MCPFEPAEKPMPICPRCGEEVNDYYKISGVDEPEGCENCVRLVDTLEHFGVETITCHCGKEVKEVYIASGVDGFLGCEDCVSLICAHEYMEEHGENLRCLAGDMRFEEARERYG